MSRFILAARLSERREGYMATIDRNEFLRGALAAGAASFASSVATNYKALDDLERCEGIGERCGADLHRRRAGHEELERVLRVRDATGADDRNVDGLRDLVGDVHGDGPDGGAR